MEKYHTVKDVAKLAGVAPSTVSLVMNGSAKVSAKTREKVKKAVEELNYVPNNFAVSLRQTPCESIAVLAPDIQNPYYLEIIQGIKHKCEKSGMRIQIVETRYDPKIEEEELNFLLGLRPVGYIFIGTTHDEELIGSLNTDKIVFIDKVDTTGKIPYVIIDNKKSMYDATAHIINKGCKDIFYITQQDDTKPILDRLQGFKQAMEEHGLDYQNRIVESYECCLNKLEAGYNHIKSILSHTKPDAVITTSDLIALGVIRGIVDKGLRVPEDISVTGFDNIDYAKYSIPTLTTVDQPRYQMGEIAFSYVTNKELKVNMLNNRIVLKSDFIIRESVRG